MCLTLVGPWPPNPDPNPNPRPQALRRLIEACPTCAAINVMHIPVDEVTFALGAVRQVWQGPLGAYPNNTTSKARFAASNANGSSKAVSVHEFLLAAEEWREAGATLVGGCCGIGPAYIAALHKHLASLRLTTGGDSEEALAACQPCRE